MTITKPLPLYGAAACIIGALMCAIAGEPWAAVFCGLAAASILSRR